MRFERPHRAARQPSVVELTPLIDVVFLLLIFFMVSTTFVRFAALEVELPEADGARAESRPSVDIEVRVGATGEYAVNERVLADAKLATLMAALDGAADGGGRVLVAADANAQHQAVVRVLDAARRSGLTSVSILTRSRPPVSAGAGAADG